MKNIRIGTRNSPLAIWQAEEVANKLNDKGLSTQIIPIESSGDKNLNQPLYAMGITGVFTKDLDIALLSDEIDIAVHSLKDVPTLLPTGIELIAYLERDYPQDVLVRNSNAKGKPLHSLKIATSSLRRRAFWLKEFPNADFVDIRGNVQTRLQKIENGLADATLFSLAGIKRMDWKIEYELLPFMVSAPSQGVITIAGNSKNLGLNQLIKEINHTITEQCVDIERQFLNTLEGGCTAPIGAFAQIVNNELRFIGRVCSLDGKQCVDISETIPVEDTEDMGEVLAQRCLNDGGEEIMNSIKNSI